METFEICTGHWLTLSYIGSQTWQLMVINRPQKMQIVQCINNQNISNVSILTFMVVTMSVPEKIFVKFCLRDVLAHSFKHKYGFSVSHKSQHHGNESHGHKTTSPEHGERGEEHEREGIFISNNAK